MRRLPHVTWLRSFEAAARHSSFSAAAEELHLTPAAVSQQIRQLEHHLGFQLFKRLPKGVELTDIGQAYAIPVRKSFVQMQEATDGLFRVQSKSVLRVRCSISFAALILAPLLRDFAEIHPDIDVELSTAVWSDRMEGAGVDLDIRYGAACWPEQNVHPLLVEEATLVCHPDYAAQLGSVLDPAWLGAADIVQIVGSETDWDRYLRLCGIDKPRPRHWMKADSSLIALQILSAGRGCALISRSFARQALSEGRLVAPFDLSLPMQESFVLVERDDLRENPGLRKLVDWLLTQRL